MQIIETERKGYSWKKTIEINKIRKITIKYIVFKKDIRHDTKYNRSGIVLRGYACADVHLLCDDTVIHPTRFK